MSEKTVGNGKKILIIRNAYSYDFGGGERIPVELAVQLRQLGYSPVVVSRSAKLLEYAASQHIPTFKGWWWSFQDWSGPKLIFLPFYLVWQLLLICWYITIIARTGSDVVHPQSRDDFIAGTIAAKLLGKSVVWTDHADLKYIYRNGRMWYKNPVGKVVFSLSRFARAVVIVSRNELGHISESLGQKAPANYQVIYNGVRSDSVKPLPRPTKDKQAVIFSTTSRLVTAKGIGELIAAFQQISTDRQDVRLWLFGEGPEANDFQHQVGDNPRIKFWGYSEDALARVAASDIFVHPSYHEGFSISLVEAAKLGLPIIACDTGGNPELVKDGENGLLIPIKDSKALYAAMQRLLEDKDLRLRYGRNARKFYEENLVWEKLVEERFAPLYE